MCYSAEVIEAYEWFIGEYGAVCSLRHFFNRYFRRKKDPKIKILRATDWLMQRQSGDEAIEIRAMIAEHDAALTTAYEQELFKQKTRLADAQRTLAAKTTKKAENDQRIATDKIGTLLSRINDLKRDVSIARDGRFFPGWYVPVMVMLDGKPSVIPMRYGCRPAGKPAFYDTKYPGTYNARRDNLTGFWKQQFGVTHGVICADAFYENVQRQEPNGQATNVVLEFRPNTNGNMMLACLWSHWTKEGEEDLYSFALITDEPPQEVAAAGHDRCVIPIKSNRVLEWLNPDKTNLDAMYALLDDRERPYYAHRKVA